MLKVVFDNAFCLSLALLRRIKYALFGWLFYSLFHLFCMLHVFMHTDISHPLAVRYIDIYDVFIHFLTEIKQNLKNFSRRYLQHLCALGSVGHGRERISPVCAGFRLSQQLSAALFPKSRRGKLWTVAFIFLWNYLFSLRITFLRLDMLVLERKPSSRGI